MDRGHLPDAHEPNTTQAAAVFLGVGSERGRLEHPSTRTEREFQLLSGMRVSTQTHTGEQNIGLALHRTSEAAWSAMLAGLGGINRALPSEQRGAARGASSPLRAGAAAWAYAPCDCGDSDTRGFICGSSSAESGGNYTSSEEGEGGGSSGSEAAEREEEKVTTAALLAGPRRTYEKRARTQVTKLGEWEKQTTT